MKRFIFLLLFINLSVNFLIASELDSLLVLLEQNMMKRNSFDKAKEQRIKSYKEIIGGQQLSQKEIYYINRKIIYEYEAYILDSATHYASINLAISEKIHEKSLTCEAKLTLAKLLTTTGRYMEASDILQTIIKMDLTDDLLVFYYDNYRQVYAELSFNSLLNSSREYYSELHLAYRDSLIKLLTPDTEKYLFLVEKQYRDNRQLGECIKINSKRLALTKMGTRTYSLVNFERSLIFELEKNQEMEMKFLALSAISDIMASVKDNASLTRLALLLYREGKVDKAFKYINFSFEDAKFYNSKLRFVAISNIFPLITEAYELKSEQQKNKLRMYVLVISALSLILFISMVYIYKQLKNLAMARNELELANKQQKNLNKTLHKVNEKLNNLNNELTEANHVKEQYIGYFLSICSNYIDKLDAYRKMVNKHISTRKVQELFELTKSRQLIDMELAEFYTTFDNTFLKIYPNFVAEFNNLLVEEERICPKKDELLTTELRIFALIRLGINDSSKIAKLLRYSVNTIYNYRAKIKNNAQGEREKFEDMVMNIGVFYQ